jgi:hypothetical protein
MKKVKMIYTHKGYQCLLLPRASQKGVQWSCKPKSSSSVEQQAFVTWSRAKLIVGIDISQAKQKFTDIVEVFLQERGIEFPLYPRPELPDATIEAIVDARVYLVANNSGKHHTAKFRVFTEERLRVFPSRSPIPVGIKSNFRPMRMKNAA